MWTALYEGCKWKLCSSCSTEKSEFDFYRGKIGPKTRKDGLSAWCKLCFSAYFKKPKIREQRQEWEREYLKRPGVKEKRREIYRKYDSSEHRKEKRKAYRSQPDTRARMAISKNKYRSNPKNKMIERYGILLIQAKKRNINVEISFSEWSILVKSNTCHYCNSELGSTGHGLDRKDSNQGYVLDNLVPCCGECNRMKSRMPYSEFILLSPAMCEIKKRRKEAKSKSGDPISIYGQNA